MTALPKGLALDQLWRACDLLIAEADTLGCADVTTDLASTDHAFKVSSLLLRTAKMLEHSGTKLQRRAHEAVLERPDEVTP